MNRDVEVDTIVLRQRAEEILRNKGPKPKIAHSEADSVKAFHELEIQKIELELQQEALQKAMDARDDIYKRYTELEDLHNRFILHNLKNRNL
jgi:hypothetical protein